MAERRPPADAADPRRVRFGVDFRRRLDTLLLRVDRARRRIEGAGRGRDPGQGEEWVGFRPYRPGDDPRLLDWQLLARLDRPFVRVARRETSERWALVIDSSASMGLGRPGKLQAAAELAAAWAALGLRSGAEVRAVAHEPLGPPRGFGRATELPAVLTALEGLAAAGDGGLEELLRRPEPAAAGRVLVLTDLAGAPPRALFELADRRSVALVQVLARHELEPGAGPVRWTDPEHDRRLELDVDAALAARYRAALSRRLEGWRAACGRHGIDHRLQPSDADFEVGLEALVLGPRHARAEERR